MGRTHVIHADVAKFATEKVNLPKEKATQYLREMINVSIIENSEPNINDLSYGEETI